MLFRIIIALGFTVALVFGQGCRVTGFMSGLPDAVCHLDPLAGSKARGKVTFTRMGDTVLAEGEFEGLMPGKHGIHIHEHGDCGGVAGAAAGGHLNPAASAHGSHTSGESHQGDLGNLVADLRGRARLSIKDKRFALTGDKSILGRSIIVHAKKDDLHSQPGGNSGARIACGVIRVGAN